MSNWQPSAQGLSDLLQLLREAINPSNDGQNVQEVSLCLQDNNQKKNKCFLILLDYHRDSNISTKFQIITTI